MTDCIPTSCIVSPMARSNTQWTRVAKLVDDRMAEIGVSQADIVRESKVSVTTVRALMTGARLGYRPSTLRAISRALHWPPLAIEQCAVEGKTPTIEMTATSQLGLRLEEIQRLLHSQALLVESLSATVRALSAEILISTIQYPGGGDS